MNLIPETEIIFLTCFLTEDQQNQFTWSSLAVQNNYFQGLPHFTLTGCSYQRDGDFIRAPINIENLRPYNYIIYRNKNYTNKWFYAFITRLEYANDNMTRVFIKTDVYQTWWKELEFEPSFIEREHVADDTVGLHTIPEDLDTGKPFPEECYTLSLFDNMMYCLQVTSFPKYRNIGKDEVEVTGLPYRFYNGMPSGCYYLLFHADNGGGVLGINKWLNAYDVSGMNDAVMALFPVPLAFLNANAGNTKPVGGQQYYKLDNNVYELTYILTNTPQQAQLLSTVLAPVNNKFQSASQVYYAKNNKLLTYPYKYFYYDNHKGSTVEYRFEDFNSTPTFTCEGVMGSSGEYKLYPSNYGLITGEKGYGYGCNIGSLPLGSWNTNMYLNWYALNNDAIQIRTDTATSSAVVDTVSGILTGNLTGSLTNGINTYGEVRLAMNTYDVAEKTPNQARGDTGSQSLAYASKRSAGSFYYMGMRAEYAKMIDDYFTMYGYKVNRLGEIDIFTRPYFNFIKTAGANVDGNVPQDHIEEMKQILNRGITFWHDPTKFLNYEVDNRPLNTLSDGSDTIDGV